MGDKKRRMHRPCASDLELAAMTFDGNPARSRSPWWWMRELLKVRKAARRARRVVSDG